VNLHVRSPGKMTVEEFLDWADARRAQRSAAVQSDEPKWELFDGVPHMQASELWLHGRVKYRVMRTIEDALVQSGLPFVAGLDCIGVRVDAHASFQPDVVVFPADAIDDLDRFAPDPVIVVEVLSPSTRDEDLTTKVAGYASVATIQHYLVVDPQPQSVLHFRRGANGLVRPSAPVAAAILHLDPPGIEIELARLFGK
jgi:Uma2 family endonuclease